MLSSEKFKYQTLVEQLPGAIIFSAYLDQGVPGDLYVSPQIEAILGFTSAEWIDDSLLWYKQTYPDDRVILESAIADLIGNQNSMSVDVRLLTKAGKIAWFHMEGRIVMEASLPMFLHGVAFNITRQKELEVSLKEAAAKLEETKRELTATNKELEQFAYVASHDLKAPLRAISNLATWIKDDLADKITPSIEKNVSLMMSRIRRMENLIDGILQYSRVGRINQDESDVPLQVVVEDYIANTDIKKFTVEIVKPLPTVKGNKTVMLQLFGNLISNSILHHTRDDGRIKIGWYDENGMYKFFVEDDGPGIGENFFPKLFQPFQTAVPRDTKESTGIGLALCYKIVQHVGGKIWADPRKHDGAKFIFTWPKK